MEREFTNLQGLILLTTACPIECEHCQYFCTKNGKWMSEKTLLRVIKEYTKNGINSIKISGGEPFFDIKRLTQALDIVSKYFDSNKIIIATSGYWANTQQSTIEILKILKEKNIKILELSVDRFHQVKVPISNVENILKESKKLNIKVILRPLFDIESRFLIDIVVNLVLKYKPSIVFSVTTPIGKAENFDNNLIGINRTLELFNSKIKKSRSYNKFVINEHLPNAIIFTTFPSGNIYICCIGSKLSYLGDINKENLRLLIKKFKRTLLGSLIINNNLNCSSVRRFNPLKNDICSICKNQPFNEVKEINDEYIGRKFIKVNLESLKKIYKFYDQKHKLLISLNLSERNLKNRYIGDEILRILHKLKSSGVKFMLSRPLPKCLFDSEDSISKMNLNIPRSCYECHELFSVDGKYFKFCKPLKCKKRINVEYLIDRKHFFRLFEKEHKRLEPSKICKSCIHYLRRNCNSLCFIK